MEIKVLGSGCAKCNKLYTLVTEVLQETGAEARVEKVTDFKQIAMAGVMMTPALMVDGDVKIAGKLPSREQLKQMLG